MAKILSFRANSKAADGTGPDQDFLHHEDHTLSFQVTESGATSLGDLGAHREARDSAPQAKDWTNQELADLFRVKRLLDAAGVPNELDRGLTDEGDPWLIFCGPDGEVFIHLCRLEGIYLLDSPNIQDPLRGADFNGLIEAFTNRALPRTGAAGADPEGRVIQIRRGGKIRLHPSALLAALIWTLFLASEEIVLMLPDAEAADEGLADLEALSFTGEHPAAEMPLLVSENTISTDAEAARSGTEADPRHLGAQHEAFLKENGNNGLTFMQNSYGMGLSTIAIAFGFMAEQSASEREALLSDAALMAEASEATEEGEVDRILAERKAATLEEAAAAEAVELANLTPEQEREAAQEMPEEKGLDAAQAVAETKAFTDGLQEAKSKIGEATLWVDTSSEAELPKVIVTAEVTEPAPEATPTTATAPAILPEAITLSTLRSAFDFQPAEMNIYAFGTTVVQASFDLSQSALDALPFLDSSKDEGSSLGALLDITEPSMSGTSGYRSFDAGALAFMGYLMGKSDGVEMIAVNSEELILIDSSAFVEGDTYVLSWATQDGSLISMVGLRSEFQEFDLIA